MALPSHMDEDVIRTETKIHVIYHQHANGIHEIIIRQASRDAVDEMFDLILQVHTSTPDDETVRFMFVYTHSAGLPLNHALVRSRKDRKFWNSNVRSANLSNNLSLINIATQLFSRYLRGLNVGFYNLGQREQAIEWLLKDN